MQTLIVSSDSINLGLVFLLAFLHCLIGGIAALVARQKGYNFRRWLLYGLIGGSAGLAIALFWLKPQTLPES